jgi:hypothetical protein
MDIYAAKKIRALAQDGEQQEMLPPVHKDTHAKLTKAGYAHTANFEPQGGQGRFGYYTHGVTGHKVTVDDHGNIANQEEEQMQQRGGGGGGARTQQRRY